MNSGATANPGLGITTQTAGGITIAELTGELDIASAPALRDQLLGLLRPGSSQLVIDLSRVSFCDASGLAVLVNTARRARLLGGFLHLAAVSPQADRVLNITGLHRHLASFPTVEAAVTGAQARTAQRGKPCATRHGQADDEPAHRRTGITVLSALAPHPLTPSPAVAATGTRLRRALNPGPQLSTT
jgi:anti-sigma B factor antagonist